MATSAASSNMHLETQPSDNLHHRTPSKGEAEKELGFGQVWKEAGDVERPTRPTLDGSCRESAVAFHTTDAEEMIERAGSRDGSKTQVSKRMSSPPPPPTYVRGISFDTFDNKDATTESFTLQYRHTEYRHNTRSRTFLCGTDAKDYSEYALEWMLDELVDDGDDIVCLRVVDKESKIASEASIDRLRYREEAQSLLQSVVRKNSVDQKAISVTLELAVGEVNKVIQRMIQLYEPAALIVGTRGRNLGGMQGLLPGSVSKYCLQHSPVPVIVVRPTNKRIKKKQKRLQETGRSLYSNMLEQSRSHGRLSLYDKSVLDSSLAPTATKKESEAVAQAIGPRRGILRNPQHGGIVGANDPSADDETSVPSFALPIGYLSTEDAVRADVAMKSPIIAMLGESWDDSPSGSNSATPKRARSKSPRPSSASASAPTLSTGTTELDPAAATASGDNPVFSEEDEDLLGVPKIVEHRRPSTREQVPWLNSILRQPERRPPSRNRSVGRSRSR